MLLTSFDYSVNLHYCQDSFAGISFGNIAKCCSSKTASCSSLNNITAEDEDPNCCTNKKVYVDDLDEDYTSPSVVDFVDQPLNLNGVFDINILSSNFRKQVISYTSYRPPPPDIDYQVQYQVFLI